MTEFSTLVERLLFTTITIIIIIIIMIIIIIIIEHRFVNYFMNEKIIKTPNIFHLFVFAHFIFPQYLAKMKVYSFNELINSVKFFFMHIDSRYSLFLCFCCCP